MLVSMPQPVGPPNNYFLRPLQTRPSEKGPPLPWPHFLGLTLTTAFPEQLLKSSSALARPPSPHELPQTEQQAQGKGVYQGHDSRVQCRPQIGTHAPVIPGQS